MIVAFASLLLLGLSDNVRGPLFAEILYTFSVSDSQGSWFFSVSSMAGILGAYFGSWWISRIGEIRSLQVSIFLMFLSQVLISVASSFSMLLVVTALFGFSLSMMGVMQNLLVVQASPDKYKTKILSGLHSMYAASSLLAPLLINLFLLLSKSSFDSVELWRRVFQVTALCSFGLWVVTFRQHRWQSISRSPKAISQGSQSRIQRLYFSIIMAAYVGAEILVSSRLALFLRREYAATLEESSWYTAAFFACLLAGRILFSVWSPRIPVLKQLIASLMMSILLFILGLSISPVFLALSGLVMAPFYPLMMSWAAEIFPKDLAAAISLGVSWSAFSVVVMHIFLGAVSDWPGIRYGFMLGPLLCLLAMGMLLSYEKIFRRV